MRIPHNERLGSDIPDDGPPHEDATDCIDASGSPARGGPERRCILSGVHGTRDSLIRLAISPDGDVLPDVMARAPGRGAWIGVDKDELTTALAKGRLKGALARAFKGAPMRIADDLPQRIEDALIRVVNDRLGLEMRSGRLLTGSDRIAENARSGRVAWLAHAADAGEDGSRKLDQAWRVGQDAEGSGKRGVTLPLDRAALSVALGRDNVVHLALTDSSAAKRLAVPLQRLLHFMRRAEAIAPENAGPDQNKRTAGENTPDAMTTILN